MRSLALSIIFAATASLLVTLTGPRGYAQELRITSPASGDVVVAGQPLRVVVAADASVRMVYVLAQSPLPEARPLGNNVFEINIPKTVSPGRYQLGAVGATTEPVFSAPVQIQVEGEDLPVAHGEGYPIDRPELAIRLAQGAHLDGVRQGRLNPRHRFLL